MSQKRRKKGQKKTRGKIGGGKFFFFLTLIGLGLLAVYLFRQEILHTLEPFLEKKPPNTGSLDALPRGQTAVTPVRTAGPEINVRCPTSRPGTSVIALSGPGVPSTGTPNWRARGLV